MKCINLKRKWNVMLKGKATLRLPDVHAPSCQASFCNWFLCHCFAIYRNWHVLLDRVKSLWHPEINWNTYKWENKLFHLIIFHFNNPKIQFAILLHIQFRLAFQKDFISSLAICFCYCVKIFIWLSCDCWSFTFRLQSQWNIQSQRCHLIFSNRVSIFVWYALKMEWC